MIRRHFGPGAAPLIEWMSAESTPSKPFPGFADGATSTALLAAILAALYRRERTGLGDEINISLLGASLFYNAGGVLTGQPQFGFHYPKSRYTQSDPMAPPFKTQDGDWLFVTETNWDTKYPAILKMIGKEEYIDDPRFKTLESTRQSMADVIKIIEDGFAHTPTAVCLAGLQAIDTVHEKLANPADLYKDEQAWANGYLREVTFPRGQKVVYPNSPVQFGSMETPEYNLAPYLGTHSVEVLKEIGYSDSEIEAVMQAHE